MSDGDEWFSDMYCAFNRHRMGGTAIRATDTPPKPPVTVDSTIPVVPTDELPNDIVQKIIDTVTADSGLRAAKVLRKIARTSKLFAENARAHEDY